MAKKKIAKKPSKKAAKKMNKKMAKKTAIKSAPRKIAKPSRPAKEKPAPVPVQKSTTVNPYLIFNGNCEEAFNFYKSVFGGQFGYIGRFKDMPPQDGQSMPPEAGDRIMHVSLAISKETVLMGSDNVPGMSPPITVGNNFSISINAATQADADRFFAGLSAGGTVTMPMGKTFWGAYFGMCTDKFGINWMFNYDLGQNG